MLAEALKITIAVCKMTATDNIGIKYIIIQLSYFENLKITLLLIRPWDASLLELACSDRLLLSDLPLPSDAPGGMVVYRKTLCLSFFLRFFSSVSKEIAVVSPFIMIVFFVFLLFFF